jgi:hypothetical protein
MHRCDRADCTRMKKNAFSIERRTRVCAAVGTALVALALPVGASAATTRGTVLLVNTHAHAVELVRTGDAVHGYRYGHGFPAVKFGSQISFTVSGNRLEHAHVRATRASRVSFYANVASAGAHGLTVQLPDRTRIAFGASALNVSSMQLKRGQRVLLTETRKRGKLQLSLPTSISGHGTSAPGGSGSGTGTGSGSGPVGGGLGNSSDSAASGVITDIGSNDVTIQLPDGSTVSPTMPASSLSYLNTDGDVSVCETVTVDYHSGAGGPVLDALTPTGISVAPIAESDGDTCADESDGGIDVVGTITALSPASVTLDVPGQGALSFIVDPTQDLLDGNAVGDVVDVTYSENPGGILTATDVEFVEEYTTGTVTSADSDTLAIKDAITGQTDTFSPGDASFAGLSPGASVGVDYYNSAGQLQGDDVESLSGS